MPNFAAPSGAAQALVAHAPSQPLNPAPSQPLAVASNDASSTSNDNHLARLAFLTAGTLLALASIAIAGLNGWVRGASLAESLIWGAAGIALAAPCASASTSFVREIEIVDSTASPSAPPICCEVLISPDARPASSSRTPATAAIVKRATAVNGNAHPIVLMHSFKASHEPESQVSSYRGNTIAALPAIIEWYHAHGYHFVRMDGKS